MRYKTILFVVLLVGIVLMVGCTKSSSAGYAAYSGQQGQGGQQQPFVGGGCGVAPVDDVGDEPSSINAASSNL